MFLLATLSSLCPLVSTWQCCFRTCLFSLVKAAACDCDFSKHWLCTWPSATDFTLNSRGWGFVWLPFHPWEPWHHLHGILKLYPMVLFFPLRLYWRNLWFLPGLMVPSLFYMSLVIYSLWGIGDFFQLCNYTFYLSVQVLPLSCSGSEVRFDLFSYACLNYFLP